MTSYLLRRVTIICAELNLWLRDIPIEIISNDSLTKLYQFGILDWSASVECELRDMADVDLSELSGKEIAIYFSQVNAFPRPIGEGIVEDITLGEPSKGAVPVSFSIIGAGPIILPHLKASLTCVPTP